MTDSNRPWRAVLALGLSLFLASTVLFVGCSFATHPSSSGNVKAAATTSTNPSVAGSVTVNWSASTTLSNLAAYSVSIYDSYATQTSGSLSSATSSWISPVLTLGTTATITVNGLDSSGNIISTGVASAAITSAVASANIVVNSVTPSYKVTGTLTIVVDASRLTSVPSAVSVTTVGPSIYGNATPTTSYLTAPAPVSGIYTYTVSGVPVGSYVVRCKVTSSAPAYEDTSNTVTLTTSGAKTVFTLTSSGFAANTSVTSLALSKTTSTSLAIGGTETLTATASPTTASNTSVWWQSSNIGVVTVDQQGNVTAVGAGTATVTATAFDASSSVTATCSYTVGSDSISLTTNQGSSPLYVSPGVGSVVATATLSGVANADVNWATSNTAVATIARTGTGTATISLVAVGTVTITATSQADSSKTATFTLTVQAVNLSTNALGLKSGYTGTKLLVLNSVITGVTYSSSDTSVVSVDSSGAITAGSNATSANRTATITVSATNASSATCAVTVFPSGSSNMKVGTNLWDISWDGWSNYFQSSAQGSSNWASTTFSGSSLASYNPWLPQFLTDLAPFNGPIRFMDFEETNWAGLVNWSDRVSATADQTAIASTGQSLSVNSLITGYVNSTNGVTVTAGAETVHTIAYEWVIDLCNRTGKDLWINVPTFASLTGMTSTATTWDTTSTGYWAKLATLINTQLNSGLKCYVEYSNETWNGTFAVQNNFTMDRGVAEGFPGMNKYYQGGAWSLYHALQIFQVFSGVSSSRFYFVDAFSGNMDIAAKALANVYSSGTYNPSNVQLNYLAIAPYIGPSDSAGSGTLDGAESAIASRFDANVAYSYTNYVVSAATIASTYSLPLISYEGGQQLSTNAGTWSANPLIYTSYYNMLSTWSPKLSLYNHYTLYGSWSSSEAWGSKQGPTYGSDKTASPKYAALVQWLADHP